MTLAPHFSTCDTLGGSVNNNARDQVHFSLDHSSDKLISFSTQNLILLDIVKKLFFSPRLGHKFGVRPICGCGLYAGKYGMSGVCPPSTTLFLQSNFSFESSCSTQRLCYMHHFASNLFCITMIALQSKGKIKIKITYLIFCHFTSSM